MSQTRQLAAIMFTDIVGYTSLMGINEEAACPGIVLNAFFPEERFEDVSNFILENTTTIGLRYYSVGKKKLERTYSKVSLENNEVQIKESKTPSGKSKYKPESGDVFKLAK